MKNVGEVSLVRIPATPRLLEYSLGEPNSNESLMILPFVELENIPLCTCDRQARFVFLLRNIRNSNKIGTLKKFHLAGRRIRYPRICKTSLTNFLTANVIYIFRDTENRATLHDPVAKLDSFTRDSKVEGWQSARLAETISAQMIYLVIGLRVEGGRNEADFATMELALQTNVRERGHSLSSILQASRLTLSVSLEHQSTFPSSRRKFSLPLHMPLEFRWFRYNICLTLKSSTTFIFSYINLMQRCESLGILFL